MDLYNTVSITLLCGLLEQEQPLVSMATQDCAVEPAISFTHTKLLENGEKKRLSLFFIIFYKNVIRLSKGKETL